MAKMKKKPNRTETYTYCDKTLICLTERELAFLMDFFIKDEDGHFAGELAETLHLLCDLHILRRTSRKINRFDSPLHSTHVVDYLTKFKHIICTSISFTESEKILEPIIDLQRHYKPTNDAFTL
ncbi:hypothetical protein [Bacillus sp. 1P06AnD]|uniref:hypothetical protein n=1 Tax=Bacillus sp. 1P06AnD TaxID=3132208 RepID=UPI0039A1D09D